MLGAVGASIVLHQIVFDQMISPRLLGKTVGLHPILSIVALLAGNLLLGIVGMILAVPVAACIQILVLALVPKLQVEIELPDGAPAATEGGALADRSRTIQAESDATETLHGGVQKAVAEVEQKIAETPAASEAESVVLLPASVSANKPLDA